MKANDLIAKATLIQDSAGKRKAVQLDWADWEDLLEFLEDVEDLEEIKRIRASGEKPIPLEQIEAELRAEGVDI